jgi:hypothetical protein
MEVRFVRCCGGVCASWRRAGGGGHWYVRCVVCILCNLCGGVCVCVSEFRVWLSIVWVLCVGVSK